MSLFFNSEPLPPPTAEYVLWCDGMGTGRVLNSSLHVAANFICKQHRAFDLAVSEIEGVRLYPVMDGMYMTSPCRETVQRILRGAFLELAEEFLSHSRTNRQFMVRAGLAYGATLHGASLPEESFVPEGEDPSVFSDSQLNQTRSALLLSSAMVPAYEAERQAPPFGVCVHESALNAPQLVEPSDKGFPSRLWRWWDSSDDETVKKLTVGVMRYLDDAAKRSRELDFPVERIKRNRDAATEYFREFLKEADPPT